MRIGTGEPDPDGIGISNHGWFSTARIDLRQERSA